MTQIQPHIASTPVAVTFYPCPRELSSGPDKIGAQFIDAQGRYRDPTGTICGVGNSREEAATGALGLYDALKYHGSVSNIAHASGIIEALVESGAWDTCQWRAGDPHGAKGAKAPALPADQWPKQADEVESKLNPLIGFGVNLELWAENRRKAGVFVPKGVEAAADELTDAAKAVLEAYRAGTFPITGDPHTEAMLTRLIAAADVAERMMHAIQQYDEITYQGQQNEVCGAGENL